MHIGHNRPLFCLCAAWMAGAGLGWLLFGAEGGKALHAGIGCTGLAGILLLACLFFARWGKQRIRHVVCLALLLTCTGLSLLNSGAFFSGQITPSCFPGLPTEGAASEPADAGEDGVDLPDTPDAPLWEVHAIVSERLSSGGQITGYGLILQSVQGKSVGTRLRPARAYLLCTYTANLRIGFEITLLARAVSLETAAGKMASSLIGDGYSLGLLSGDELDCTVTAEKTGLPAIRLNSLRQQLAARLEASVGPDGLGLPSALLLGDRSSLAPTLRRDFARAGVSHLLAVSGLHLTLLFGMLSLLLKLFRLPHRIQAVLLALLVTVYLAVLGFPPSATRAAVMLGLVYLSRLCAASTDPLTSLGLAGALILGFSPSSVADAGFWMSFSATIGLLAIPSLPKISQPKKKKRTLQSILARAAAVPLGILTGLAAMTFSLWITSLTVGSVSLWSPLTTLLLTPLCGFILIASLLALPLAKQWVGKTILLPALRSIAGWMERITASLGKSDWAVLSLRQPRTSHAIRAVILAMTLYLLLWLFLSLPKKAQWSALLPVIAGWGIIIALVWAPSQTYSHEVLTSYLRPTASSEAIVLVHGREAVLCDLTDSSRTALGAAVDEADALGATEISALILTHYHTRTAGTLWHLFAAETVRALWLPSPDTADDYYRMLSCLHEAEKAGVPAFVYGQGDTLNIFGSDGNGILLTLYADRLTRSAQPVLLLHLAGADGSLTYCGSSVFESGLADTARRLTADSTCVLFGAHGPSYKQAYAFEPSRQTRRICFADRTVAAWFMPECLPPDPPRMEIGGTRLIMQRRQEKKGLQKIFDIPPCQKERCVVY